MNISLGEDGIYSFEDPYVRYFCPVCGDIIPNFWNAYITDEERAHLQGIVDNIKTPEEAIEQLGPPDYDFTQPQCAMAPSTMRNIEYYRLSEKANLEFYFSNTSPMFYYIVIKSDLFYKDEPLSETN